VLIRYPFPDYPQEYRSAGVTTRICETPLGCNPRLAGIKHLNRLEQVLARSEWEDPAIQEGIMLDSDGHIIEGTMSNLFLISNNMLYTPDLSRCGVTGVMREVVIELANSLGISVKSITMHRSMLEEGDELFLTNSLIGIWPVVRCDDKVYALGAVTSLLQQSLAPLLEL
jgi:4-amino-4-deoxychorismate lyase